MGVGRVIYTAYAKAKSGTFIGNWKDNTSFVVGGEMGGV
jgi:hypothetical protein